MKKRSLFLFALVLLWLLFSLPRLEKSRSELTKQQLSDTLRRTAAACYAAEGFYPPDVAYMTEHYGLQFDPSRYAIGYELFADNLMPEITVLEVVP